MLRKIQFLFVLQPQFYISSSGNNSEPVQFIWTTWSEGKNQAEMPTWFSELLVSYCTSWFSFDLHVLAVVALASSFTKPWKTIMVISGMIFTSKYFGNTIKLGICLQPLIVMFALMASVVKCDSWFGPDLSWTGNSSSDIQQEWWSNLRK